MEPLPAFVARRRSDWEALEGLLGRLAAGHLSLSEVRRLDLLYRRAAADLAAAQGAYAGTEAHAFLNQLCTRGYQALYRPRGGRWVRVSQFFREEFPQTVRAEARLLMLSSGLFALGILFGASLLVNDPGQARWLVPEGVRTSVAEHKMWTDPMLSAAPPSFHASSIATNNLTVVILTFASGILGGLGSAWILLQNGVLLGAVTALCLREGMGSALLGFVGAHGPVELSTIVVAGAAGLGLGKALLDPGELPRRVALRKRAQVGVRLLLGCAPFLGAIGLVEGFVSPDHLFGLGLKVFLGLALGLGFWTYVLGAGHRLSNP